MIKKLLKYLSSLRFTLLLISLLGLIFLLGLWIPQRALVKGKMFEQWQANSPALVGFLEAIQFTEIYTSPITVALWALFFLNLALVMWQRLPLIRSRITISEAKLGDPESASGYPFRAAYSLPPKTDAAAITGFLRKRRYSVLEDGERFFAVRNRLSPIAFGLFHLSFFLILLGGLTSVYTKFIGMLDVAEGETFQGEAERYNPTPQLPKLGSPPRASFMIKSIVPLISGNTPTGLKVQLVDDRGRTHHLDINRPYVVDSTSFVIKSLGAAPLFVIRDAAGKEIEGAYIKLDVMNGKKDSFSMAGFDFRVQFYPDYVAKDGLPSTRSGEFNNPVFVISVEQGGNKIADGIIPKNGALSFDGHRLEMLQMPYWVRFSVIKEHGIPLLYTGFAIASVAIVWRFLFYRREIIGAVRRENGGLRLFVAGRSEFYKSLAEDEFTALFNEVTGGRDDHAAESDSK